MTRRLRPWRVVLVVALVLSLLANAAFIGVAVRLHETGGGVRAGFAGAPMDLPPEVRRPFLRALATERADLARLRGDLVESRARFVEAATTRPFDRDLAEAAAAEVRAATARLQEVAQAILLDTIERRREGRTPTQDD